MDNKCKCHSLILPRWDLYRCPYCDRKLAGFSSEGKQEKMDNYLDEHGFRISKYLNDYLKLEEKYNKLVSFLKQEIALREHICTTNHAVLLDNAEALLKQLGEIDG